MNKRQSGAFEEKKQTKKYVLTVLRENGEYETVSENDLALLENLAPQVAALLRDENMLSTLPLQAVEQPPIFESWDLAAKRIMNQLWKMS